MKAIVQQTDVSTQIHTHAPTSSSTLRTRDLFRRTQFKDLFQAWRSCSEQLGFLKKKPFFKHLALFITSDQILSILKENFIRSKLSTGYWNFQATFAYLYKDEINLETVTLPHSKNVIKGVKPVGTLFLNWMSDSKILSFWFKQILFLCE